MKISDSFNSIQLIKFTIPTMVMMIITSIYGVVDGLFISNISGSIAFAAVNLTLPIIMILSSLGFMIGTGGSALVSKTLGEGKEDLANSYFSMLVYFLIIGGLLFSLFSFLFIGKIVRIVGANEDTIGYCVVYGKILSLFLPFYMLQNAFQNFMIVAEKPDMGLKVTIMAAITNMVLDYLLIPRLGVSGAAIATGMGQIVGALFPLIYFFRCKESIHFVKTHLELSPILKGCFNGSSEMVTNLSMSSVNILYNYQLLRLLGNNGVVAYGIIMYISFIFSGVFMGYSFGVSPIISYHYGSNNTIELKSLFKKSITIIMIFAIVLTFLAELSSGLLASIFVSYDLELLELTTLAIRIYSICYIIQGINIFASSLFTALNNGLVSGILSFARTLVFQVTMVIVLPLILGSIGIWLAIGFAEGLGLLVSVYCIIKYSKTYHYL